MSNDEQTDTDPDATDELIGISALASRAEMIAALERAGYGDGGYGDPTDPPTPPDEGEHDPEPDAPDPPAEEPGEEPVMDPPEEEPEEPDPPADPGEPDDELDPIDDDPTEPPAVATTRAVGDDHKYRTIQAAFDDLEPWEGAKIAITESYDERRESFPIVAEGRRNRTILEDHRARTQPLGHTISSNVDAVIKLDTGLHKPPGIQLRNLWITGNGRAQDGVLGLSERRSLYEHVVVTDCRRDGFHHTRNEHGHAMNSHTWIACFTSENGRDGVHVDGAMHGLTLYDHDANSNARHGVRITGGASVVAFGGSYQNNGAAGIYSTGIWDFNAMGSYFERVSGASSGAGQADAELRIEGAHMASATACYGNGGGRTGHMIKLRNVNAADVRSCYGWRYTDRLISARGCRDVDVHAPSCYHIQGSPNSTTIVDPVEYRENTRPRSDGTIGAACAPLTTVPSGAYEGDELIHPTKGKCVWRSGSWVSV